VKRTFVQKNRDCFNCLGKNHVASKCFFAVGCTDCKEAHHPSLCPRNQRSIGTDGGKPQYGGKKGKPNRPQGNQGNSQSKQVQFSKVKPESDSSDDQTTVQGDREYAEKNGLVIKSNLRSNPNGANTSGKNAQR
jgi:hypothetical protein